MVSSGTMSDCLSMCGVWKSYDAGVRGCSATVSVLRDVHLNVAAGEMVGIAAAPASGKTTLLMVTLYNQVVAEMKKVTWPDIGQVRQLSIGVIILSLFIGLVIWAMDVVLQQVLVKWIPSLFGG